MRTASPFRGLTDIIARDILGVIVSFLDPDKERASESKLSEEITRALRKNEYGFVRSYFPFDTPFGQPSTLRDAFKGLYEQRDIRSVGPDTFKTEIMLHYHKSDTAVQLPTNYREELERFTKDVEQGYRALSVA